MVANILLRRNRLLQQLRDSSANFQNFYVSTSSLPRMLAYSQFWLYLIYSSTLAFGYVVHWGISRVPDNTMVSLHGPENYNEELSFDMSLFSQFSFNLLIMHSCYCLKKTTFVIMYFLLICTIMVKYFENWDARGTVIKGLRKNYGHHKDYEELEYEFAVFSRISFYALVMVACVHLRNATFAHNLQYIKFFMVLQFSDLMTTFATYFVASTRVEKAELFIIGSIVFVLKSYMLRIVYKFYLEEVISAKSLSIQCSSTTNNVCQT